MPARGSELRLGPSWRGAPGGQLSSEGSGGVRRSPAEAAQLRRELERPRPGAARTRRSSHQVATRSQHQELGRPRLVSQAEVRQSQAEVRSGPAQSQLRARSQRQVPGSSTRQAPGESQLAVPGREAELRVVRLGHRRKVRPSQRHRDTRSGEWHRREVRRSAQAQAQARRPAVSTGARSGNRRPAEPDARNPRRERRGPERARPGDQRCCVLRRSATREASNIIRSALFHASSSSSHGGSPPAKS